MPGELTGLGVLALVVATGAVLLPVAVVRVGLAVRRQRLGRPPRWPWGGLVALGANAAGLLGLQWADDAGTLQAFARPLEAQFPLAVLGWLALLGLAGWLGRCPPR